MILTYDEYKELGGGLDNTAFEVFGYEAEMKVKAETHGRITESEAVKRCIVRVSQLLKESSISEKKVTSWSNDGVSETIKDITLEEYNTKIKSIIHDYLINEVDESGVPLLYLGGVLYD